MKHRCIGVAARCGALSAVLVSGGGCFGLPPFECADSDQCVSQGIRGACEPSGFCSFPDDECASGRRYTTEAPESLATQCVEPMDTGTGTGTGSDSGSGSTDDATTLDDTGDLSCADFDEDGFGLGAGCDGPDCDDDNPAVHDACVYVRPDGDDEAPGTIDAPWRTFPHALSQLRAADSLVVLDGTYPTAEHGEFAPNCAEGFTNGTSDAPIFVRTQSRRGAVLDTDGRGRGIAIEDCRWWRVRDLVVRGADRARDDDGQFGTLVNVLDSTDLELRGLAVLAPNRYFNNHGILVVGVERVLLEDVEVYDFHRNAFQIQRSNELTCRRCYANSRNAEDLPECPDLVGCTERDTGTQSCPRCSSDADRGDHGFIVENSSRVRLENCVSEGADSGFRIRTTGANETDGSESIWVEGSLSLGDDRGFEVEAWGAAAPLRDVTIHNSIIDGSGQEAIYAQSVTTLDVSSVTITAAGEQGIEFGELSDVFCADVGGCSFTAENILVVDAATMGIDVSGPSDFAISGCNVFGSGGRDFRFPGDERDPIDDDAGNARDNLSVAPTGVGPSADQCLVYVPEDSNMKGAGIDGDIGANIVWQVGVEAQTPLWTDDGPFSCTGDASSGEPGCHNLHQRARVGTAACSVPQEGA